ncbi:MAG: multicopper oxidase domain-containing protein [Candidatus Thiodiazotropha sp.]|jgi:manganese oxidase
MMMRKLFKQPGRLMSVLMLGVASLMPWTQSQAAHDIRGITPDGGVFNLYAFPFNINLPEGTSLYMWGFGDMNQGAQATDPAGNGYAMPQYPAPTLIVETGQTITINMTNYGVPDPVSIVVTGHHVTASGGSTGLITQAANVGETVSYTFTAGSPGTYIYHSLDGANPGLHAEMGLQGVLVVRPADGTRTAYGEGTGTDYDQENLYLMTEIDPDIHMQMEKGHYNHFTNSDRYAKVWFINGRVFPDLFQGDYNPLFPNQPYESLVQAHPGDVVFVRNVNAGQDSHPMHYHGENMRFIGRDGKMLSSDDVVADLGRSDNTINSAPKQTVDALWTWTGKNLGWDVYGYTPHSCNDTDGDGFSDGPDLTESPVWFEHEWCGDHNHHLSDLVNLPGVGDLTVGGWWSGSPFLGDVGDLPPGEGGLNPYGGYFLVWHSHAEKELTTFNIFPGGSLGAVVILPPDVLIN